MKERGILFNGEMVNAVLNGTKTQTRRPIKPQPFNNGFQVVGKRTYDARHPAFVRDRSPWQVGMTLWVRETHALVPPSQYDLSDLTTTPHPCDFQDSACVYRQEWDQWGDDNDCTPEEYQEPIGGWRPSIHMPRWASRIDLDVTRVWVERVQEIAPADCVAEGVTVATFEGEPQTQYACSQYAYLWDSICGKTEFHWDANPWVWACEFCKVEG